ncbi:GNAT family N-acetyltransferase [Corallincola platygyrae]|uniref:GNAT family N-acetyltransferase n=1 Tax=Corallincola platygyrae TaxID=1193278 RepID=A0ABW4XPI8_9GAMM
MSTSNSQANILVADYQNPSHGEAILALLDQYAQDPMGGGTPISEKVRNQLIGKLAQNATAVSFLAELDGEYVGLANCFLGFSTFACEELINIHDFAVSPSARGKGIGKQLMRAVEQYARERGCCKVTLEVLEGNHVAKALYQKCGFAGYALDPEAGHALFWDKKLT